MFRPITYGTVSMIIGGVGILSRGLNNLSRGEASASFRPSSANNLEGVFFSILFWGGILLIILGILKRITNKNKN